MVWSMPMLQNSGRTTFDTSVTSFITTPPLATTGMQNYRLPGIFPNYNGYTTNNRGGLVENMNDYTDSDPWWNLGVFRAITTDSFSLFELNYYFDYEFIVDISVSSSDGGTFDVAFSRGLYNTALDAFSNKVDLLVMSSNDSGVLNARKYISTDSDFYDLNTKRYFGFEPRNRENAFTTNISGVWSVSIIEAREDITGVNH